VISDRWLAVSGFCRSLTTDHCPLGIVVWPLVAGVVVAALAVVAAAATPSDVEQYLLQIAKFSAAETASLESGAVIARVIPGGSDSEIVTVAAVKIRASRQQTLLLRPDDRVCGWPGHQGIRPVQLAAGAG